MNARRLALVLLVAVSATPPAGAGAGVSVPRDLDGAVVTYAMTYARDSLAQSASPSGGGTLALSIDGAAPTTDAGGGTQLARRYTFAAEGGADVAYGTYEDLDGEIAYALDPVGGRPVQTRIDADVTWSSLTNPRFRYRMTANHTALLDDLGDTLLPVVRLLDTLGGRSYQPGERIPGAFGVAHYASARALETIDLVAGPSRGGPPKQPERITALPLDFVLLAAAGIEVAGTAYLQDGASLPAKLDLRYTLVASGRAAGTMTLVRSTATEGAPLPGGLPAFVHPAAHPDVETSPGHATGSRAPSWLPRPSIEEVVAIARAEASVAAYAASYPGIFPYLVLVTDSAEGVAALALASPQLRDLGERAYGLPLWMVMWYATEDPGVAVLTFVSPDRLTGEFTAVSTAGSSFLPPDPPARTLTSSWAVAAAEAASPLMVDDGTTTTLLGQIASPNVWVAQRGPSTSRAVADPARALDILQPWMPQACAFLAPDPGAQVLLDGEGGLLLGVIEATYVSPYVPAAERVAACASDPPGLDLGDPNTIPHRVNDLTDDAEGLATLTDGSRRPHAPILIADDADFLLPAAISGVTGGSGTRDDPYVIAGWNLRTDLDDGSRHGGITISGTTKHVLIKDNTLSGDGIGVWVERARNVRVEGNRAIGVGIGVAVLGLDGGAIAQNTIVGGGTGIHVQNYLEIDQATFTVTATPVLDLAIASNQLDRAHFGMAIFGTYGRIERLSIANNKVAHSDIGIVVLDGMGTTLRDNRWNASGTGAYVQRGGVAVDGDVFAGTEGSAVLAVGATVSIANARAEDGGFGVLATGGARATIEGTRFDANGRAVVSLHGSDVTVRDSVFRNSAGFGAYRYAGVLDAAGNDWGAVTGPGGCGPGDGDRIACGVAYAPFLGGP